MALLALSTGSGPRGRRMHLLKYTFTPLLNEHPTHVLNLLVGEPVRAEWTTEGRCRSAINEPGTIYLLPRGMRDKVAWMHQSSRVMLAIDPKFLAQSVEETAHLEDVALTPDWELKDRHIAALMMALRADLEDGSRRGPSMARCWPRRWPPSA
jgi:hypothetical protein